MLSIAILGSGSAGNSAVVISEKCKLLIDGGLSARQICARLETLGIAPEELDGVLLTHEHGDHICGLNVFCKKFQIPIFTNALTAEAVKRVCLGEHRNWKLFRTGSEFSVKDITIETFPVPHDAAEPVGFALHQGQSSLGFITDLGFTTKLIMERLRQVSTMVIETNHDAKMLQNDTRRPWSVKQRILSRHGHLSNDAAAEVVCELADGNLKRVVLGHLSRDCNSPALAIGAVRSRLGSDAMEIFCASQSAASPVMLIAERAGKFSEAREVMQPLLFA